MAFIARAAAPILPGWLGRESTIRMPCKHCSGVRGVFIVNPRFMFGRPLRPIVLQPTKPLCHPALNIAIKAARRTAQIINRASNDLDILKVTTKTL